MRALTTFLVFPLFALSAAACSGADEADDDSGESSESALVGHVSGSSISSGFVDPNKAYLSVRRIDTLVRVGALRGAVLSVAQRADGIIAAKPADGRVSTQELVRLESPAIFNTLFPDERAALPLAWKLMETVDGPVKSTPNVAGFPNITANDVSVAPGTLTPPNELAIGSLPAALVTAARRVQLTEDADDDATTIQVVDLNAVLANTGAYTDAEVAQFKAILALFHARATSPIEARVEVPAPFARSTVLGTFGTLTLSVDDRLTYRERRSLSLFNPYFAEGRINVSLEAVTTRVLKAETMASAKVVLINEATEAESLFEPNNAAIKAGSYTLEVWVQGQRQSSHRVSFASDLSSNESKTDLSNYRDYEIIANGTALSKNVIATSKRRVSTAGTSYEVEYNWDTTMAAPPAGADRTAILRVATPTNLPAGRYEIPLNGMGTFTLDVAPSGAVWLARPNSPKERSFLHVWHGQANFTVDYSDRFRMLLDPGRNVLKLFFDGESYKFDGSLTPAMRKG